MSHYRTWPRGVIGGYVRRIGGGGKYPVVLDVAPPQQVTRLPLRPGHLELEILAHAVTVSSAHVLSVG
eukprot:2607475-Rhodomonas_salina.1